MTNLRVSAGVWNEVFGKDASTPVKVFVTGNHERGYFEQAKRKGDFKEAIRWLELVPGGAEERLRAPRQVSAES